MCIMSLSGAGTRLRDAPRAQATPLGYIILISIIVFGTTSVVVLGASALADTQSQTELQRAEHSMTLFDSRAAMVALGESDVQSVDFGQDGGSFESRPEAGWIALVHRNYEPGETEELYNQSLGEVVYRNGDTVMAYQGGGVWRSDGGEARMVSPPEFHYRRATLTLPIIQVRGQASGSGSIRAIVSAETQARQVFPNSTVNSNNGTGAPYDYDGVGEPYVNPVEDGDVFVWVHSDYYEAWAGYFRQRTTGNVTVFDSNETVRLNLVSLGGAPGDFDVPEPANTGGGAVRAGAMGGGHPVNEFSVTLSTDNNLNNGHWSLWSDSGTNELEIHLLMNDNCGGGSYTGTVDMRIYYRNTSTGVQEEWYAEIPETDTVASTTAVDVTCSGGVGDSSITVDFMNTVSELEYQDFMATGTTNKWKFPDHIDDPADPTTQLTQHGVDPGTTFDSGDLGPAPNTDSKTVEFLSNHYLSRLPPSFTLRVQGGPGSSNRIDEESSTGTLRYPETVSAQYITYLHVTENEINVEFD